MDEFLIVDGYNIVNYWPMLKDIANESLEQARIKLIDILQDYQGYMEIHVILVFDAHLTNENSESHEFYGNVEVVYTRKGETADQYIERWVNDRGKIKMIRVATSDYLEQTTILSRGAIRMSARELVNEINRAKEEIKREHLCKLRPKYNTLDYLVNSDILKKLKKIRRQR